MAVDQFDSIVIGSGQGGGPLAVALAQAGRRTALIEKKHVGGTCVNEGCTPTKTMVASGRVAYLARRGADYGVHTGAVSIDLARVRERKRYIVDSFRNGSQQRIEKTANLQLIFGEASFIGPKRSAFACGMVRSVTFPLRSCLSMPARVPRFQNYQDSTGSPFSTTSRSWNSRQFPTTC
jgi:pyruvate/2-oxoglutarate dehydrogenase complex dihydrolipoamide dehydrogenase (E3) component